MMNFTPLASKITSHHAPCLRSYSPTVWWFLLYHYAYNALLNFGQKLIIKYGSIYFIAFCLDAFRIIRRYWYRLWAIRDATCCLAILSRRHMPRRAAALLQNARSRHVKCNILPTMAAAQAARETLFRYTSIRTTIMITASILVTAHIRRSIRASHLRNYHLCYTRKVISARWVTMMGRARRHGEKATDGEYSGTIPPACTLISHFGYGRMIH